MNLQNRSAIITGASRGLGRAIAEAYVRAGASVMLTARDEESLKNVASELQSIAAIGQQVTSFVSDVTNADSCNQIVARAVALFGKSLILVNNAGIYGPMGSIQSVDVDQWINAINVNLFGVVHMCRAVIPHMLDANYGKIINISGGGATAPLPGISAYAASKAAVVRLTETLAHELKEAYIDVNAVAPGALNTRLLDEVLAAGPEKVGKEFYEKSVQQRENGGTPLEKGASLCVYLASAQSDGITGRLISAVWDPWQDLQERREALDQSDIYTLRRIVPEDRG